MVGRTSSLALIALVACTPLPDHVPDGADPGLYALVEGSPEAVGILDLLNDIDTTETFLDRIVELDRRAARGLVHHRNGPDGRFPSADDDLFDSIEEVDGVYYVGASALGKLRAYAERAGWVPHGDDLLGVYDGVGFTVNEAEATVDFVNVVDEQVLDEDLLLDSRAVDSLLRARPVASVQELSDLYYWGEFALEQAKFHATLGLGHEEQEDTCLLISEYIEGGGQYNKAVEIWNCGTQEVDLADVALCLVRNDDTSCTRTEALSPVLLPPGRTHTVCRTTEGTWQDPIAPIRENCDQELPGVTTFNGDDRLVLFEDYNGTGDFEPGSDDRLLDAFGETAVRPKGGPWANVTLRRCVLEAYDGAAEFDALDWFTAHSGYDANDFGVPPRGGCY